MNFEDLKTWKSGVEELLKELDRLVDTRNQFIELMKSHIDQCFQGYKTIEFKNDLSEITITYEQGHNPIIRPEHIHKLGMDWLIEAGFDDKAFRIVVIKLYPFGLNEGDYIED